LNVNFYYSNNKDINFDGESVDPIRNHLKNNTIPELRAISSNWFKEMRDKFTNNTTSTSIPKQTSINGSGSNNVSIPVQEKYVNSKTISMIIEFRAPKEELFNTIFDSNRISGITQRPAKIVKEVGGVFSLFGGSVTGITTEIVQNTKVVQKWRSSSWPSDIFSIVTIEFENASDGCKITLKQTGVPEADYERTETGWKSFYWEPMRMLFGFVNLSSM